MTTFTNAETFYLSVEQVAERYGVSPDSIWRWKRDGDFPAAVRLGKNCTRWRLSDLLEYEGRLKACCVVGFSFSEAA